MNTPFEAFLFDLDGTILDTGPEFFAILNELLTEMGKLPILYEELRPAIGRGGAEMLRVALGLASPFDPQVRELLPIFLERYAENIARHTSIFEGIETVLLRLKEEGIPWGIVTNKHTRFTELLLETLPLPTPPLCVVCGDTLPRAKPHPDPLFHACALLEKNPKKTLFIGDGMNDILAARNAKMPFVWARYGYVDHDKAPDGLTAIDTPLALLSFIK